MFNETYSHEAWENRLRDLIQRLRSGPIHCTSVEAFIHILDRKAILPNDGTRTFSYPQSENSYAFYKNYVSLFDFGQLPEDEIFCELEEKMSIGIHCPTTVILQLDREAMKGRLIGNSAAQVEVGYKKVWIPKIESWYPDPIPIQFVKTCLAICGYDECACEYYIQPKSAVESIRDFHNWISDDCVGIPHEPSFIIKD